jgi:endonuclease YncB( thermonuclease family)
MTTIKDKIKIKIKKNKLRQIFINIGFLIKKFIMKNILAQYNKTNTKFFSLDGLNSWARVVGIHDADTITCILNLNIYGIENKFYRFNIRLSGIDSPEITSKNKELQNLAIKARNRLFHFITNHNHENCEKKEQKELDALLNDQVFLVYLKCSKFDKYGRVLANIYKNEFDESTINDILLKEKLVYPYTGKTKLNEEEQETYFN